MSKIAVFKTTTFYRQNNFEVSQKSQRKRFNSKHGPMFRIKHEAKTIVQPSSISGEIDINNAKK